jgi:hypothetical protein
MAKAITVSAAIAQDDCSPKVASTLGAPTSNGATITAERLYILWRNSQWLWIQFRKQSLHYKIILALSPTLDAKGRQKRYSGITAIL